MPFGFDASMIEEEIEAARMESLMAEGRIGYVGRYSRGRAMRMRDFYGSSRYRHQRQMHRAMWGRHMDFMQDGMYDAWLSWQMELSVVSYTSITVIDLRGLLRDQLQERRTDLRISQLEGMVDQLMEFTNRIGGDQYGRVREVASSSETSTIRVTQRLRERVVARLEEDPRSRRRFTPNDLDAMRAGRRDEDVELLAEYYGVAEESGGVLGSDESSRRALPLPPALRRRSSEDLHDHIDELMEEALRDATNGSRRSQRQPALGTEAFLDSGVQLERRQQTASSQYMSQELGQEYDSRPRIPPLPYRDTEQRMQSSSRYDKRAHQEQYIPPRPHQQHIPPRPASPSSSSSPSPPPKKKKKEKKRRDKQRYEQDDDQDYGDEVVTQTTTTTTATTTTTERRCRGRGQSEPAVYEIEDGVHQLQLEAPREKSKKKKKSKHKAVDEDYGSRTAGQALPPLPLEGHGIYGPQYGLEPWQQMQDEVPAEGKSKKKKGKSKVADMDETYHQYGQPTLPGAYPGLPQYGAVEPEEVPYESEKKKGKKKKKHKYEQ